MISFNEQISKDFSSFEHFKHFIYPDLLKEGVGLTYITADMTQDCRNQKLETTNILSVTILLLPVRLLYITSLIIIIKAHVNIFLKQNNKDILTPFGELCKLSF